jgi:2-hydroxy-3-oxopropionate reductase
MADRTVGFIGLGIMGRPMALNLRQAGYALVVHNRTAARVEPLLEAGAEAVASPREVAARSDVVVTMLSDSSAVERVYRGEDGVLAGVRAGQLLIDMSSVDASVARSIWAAADAAGSDALDAPVSGGDVGAKDATLSIMVGGSEAAFERARPIFERLGKTIIRVGGPGTGQIAKACNQIIVALTIEAVSEALVLGSRGGVDPATLISVFQGGLAANRVMEVRGRNLLEHDFAPGFMVDLHHKDLGIALAAARELGVFLPATAQVDQMLQELRQAGEGRSDHSALLTVIERGSNHRIGDADAT